jgi:hypothetical protein
MAEIIPRHEQRLHGLVMTSALAVAIGEACKTTEAHAEREVEALNTARAYLIPFWFTEDWQRLSAYNRG